MKMKIESKKPGWSYLPYFYLIGLAAFWFFGEMLEGNNFSYLAIAIMIILVAQAFIQNRFFGLALGIFVMALNFAGFLAVISEFNDFQIITRSAIELITVGSVLSLSGLAMGIFLTRVNAARIYIK
ncbi:MAG: hypothetical protein ACO1O1_14450 [Adhaeribacter sp.]